jgi:hypothetical protein
MRSGGGRQVDSKARPKPPAWLRVIPPPPRTLSHTPDGRGHPTTLHSMVERDRLEQGSEADSALDRGSREPRDRLARNRHSRSSPLSIGREGREVSNTAHDLDTGSCGRRDRSRRDHCNGASAPSTAATSAPSRTLPATVSMSAESERSSPRCGEVSRSAACSAEIPGPGRSGAAAERPPKSSAVPTNH